MGPNLVLESEWRVAVAASLEADYGLVKNKSGKLQLLDGFTPSSSSSSSAAPSISHSASLSNRAKSKSANKELTPAQIRDVIATRCALRAGGTKGLNGTVASILLKSVQAPNFPDGWLRNTTGKTHGKTFGRVEHGYVDDQGRKFRSENDARAFLETGEVKSRVKKKIEKSVSPES